MLRRHVLSALVLLAASLPALGSSPAGAAGGGDPMYGAPDVGACYNVPLAAADKAALRDKTVPCTERHSLWIVGVIEAPKSVKFDFSSTKFWRFVDKACSKAQDDAIGDQMHRYLRTVYQNFFFLPTKAQQRHGAHWISCELGWLVGNERLVPTRLSSPPRLRADMSDELSLCMAKYRVQCSRPHQWRSAYGTLVRGTYTPEALERAAHRVCPDRTNTRRWTYSGGAPVGFRTYSLTCFDRTTR